MWVLKYMQVLQQAAVHLWLVYGSPFPIDLTLYLHCTPSAFKQTSNQWISDDLTQIDLESGLRVRQTREARVLITTPSLATDATVTSRRVRVTG